MSCVAGEVLVVLSRRQDLSSQRNFCSLGAGMGIAACPAPSMRRAALGMRLRLDGSRRPGQPVMGSVPNPCGPPGGELPGYLVAERH